MSCCNVPRESIGTSIPAIRGTKALRAKKREPAHQVEQIRIPEGSYLMGDHFDEGYSDDGERPVHQVRVDGFHIDATAVTVADFGRFVTATGYITDAERYGSSAVFHLEVQDHGRIPDGARAVPNVPWWIDVPGACWHAPAGPGSQARSAHPVVHVSWHDAQEYCAWAGRALPTEAQWEYAARGGYERLRYSWGNDLLVRDSHRCNIFQGDFPRTNTVADGYLATAPAREFAPNGFGLYQMAGNVWEWCHDWFDATYYEHSPIDNPVGPSVGQGRVMRGGSFLCHESYCNRYRVAARSRNTPDSSSSNCGFRTVLTAG